MSERPWTKGPWEYAPDQRNVMRVYSGEREIVRALSTHGLRKLNKGERAANARLIAASPDLYEALQGLLGLLTLIEARDDISAALRDVLRNNHRVKAADQAAAKALDGCWRAPDA